MIRLLFIENEKQKSHHPSNWKFTSPDIQNNLIRTASNLTLKYKLKRVHLWSKIFSLIVNEAKDESKIEQMSVCTRYLHDSKIKERFWEFIELNEWNAQAIWIA